MRNFLIFITLLFLSVPASSDNTKWILKSVKEIYQANEVFNQPIKTEIEFSNGHVASTRVIQFKFKDFITSKENVIFIIFSGRTCSHCDMNISIYIKAVAAEEYSIKRYSYPGKLKSYLNGELINDTRMFYGECLKQGEQTVIFYSHYRVTDGKWREGVYDVDFQANETVKNTDEIPYEKIKETETLKKLGKCFEVYGKVKHSES